jgi:hypothetical protein
LFDAFSLATGYAQFEAAPFLGSLIEICPESQLDLIDLTSLRLQR